MSAKSPASASRPASTAQPASAAAAHARPIKPRPGLFWGLLALFLAWLVAVWAMWLALRAPTG